MYSVFFLQLLTLWPNFSHWQRRLSFSSLFFADFSKMATSTSSPSYANTLHGSASRDGDSQRPSVLVLPLHHVPALSEKAVFIDLPVVKSTGTVEERNDILLEDLCVSNDKIFYEVHPKSK